MKEMKLDVKKKELPKSEIELTITIPREEIEQALKKIYAKIAPEVSVTGFRPGKAPKERILAQLGPTLYEKTLNYLLPEVTMMTLEKEGLTPIDQVRYSIEKFEAEGELVYTATFPVFPEVKIGNLKKIKVKKEKVKVTDEDVEKVLNEMFEEWKRSEEAKFKEEKGKIEETKKVKDADKAQAILKYSKPTDQWAKEETNLKVENLAELREKIRKEITGQKESLAEAEYHNNIIAQAVKLSQITIPQIFIEQELDRRIDKYKARLDQLGLKFEDFLRAQKTTVEKLREGMSDNAKAFIESEIFLLKYAEQEGIKVDEKEVQKQIGEVEDAKTKEKFGTPDGRRYIREVLLKQKAFNRLLEVVEGKK